MTGVMFNAVGGGDIDLNGGNVTIAGLTGGADDTESDLIMTWDASKNGYTTYYYYYEDGAADEDVRWWDAGGESEPIFPAGTAFWYKAKSGTGKSVTISGAVESDADVTFDFTGGRLNMCVNPYPAAIDLNDASTVEITNLSGGADDTDSDLILAWDATKNGYTTYYYYYEDGAADEDVRWWDAGGESEPVIEAGSGFWYKAKAGTGKQITFKRPF